MSSDLLDLDFDNYYQAPPQKSQSSFPSNAANTPRTNDVLGFNSSSTNNWQEGGISQWSAQPSTSWNSFATPSASTGQQNVSNTAADPWANLESLSHSFQQPAASKSYSSTNDARTVPKPGIMRQPTSLFFDSPGMSRSTSFDKFDGPIAEYIEKKKSGNTKPISAAPSSLRHEITQSSAPEVLFDADEELEDDDFGEFEAPTSFNDLHNMSVNELQNIPVISPLKLGDPPATPKSQSLSQGSPLYQNNYPKPPKSPSFHDRNPFSDLVLATQSISEMTLSEHEKSSPTPETPWPTYDKKPVKPKPRAEPLPQEIEEDWGDFADLAPETPDVEIVDHAKADWSWESQQPTSHPKTIPDSPPPTNIPPPSILLPIFQTLFDLPRSTLFQPIANQPFSLKNRILSDPSTIDFLRGYLLIAVVAARILAGRKLRWKRDHHLSQAMKIGLAGGKGGMKLTGIDKAESAREDREASDTVQIWKEQLGRLRSAVTVANSSLTEKTKKLVIPEINEHMLVRSVGIEEGSIADAKACVLCGIKREERIGKVDVGVEDSFGEFWVEYWGHRDCRNFWREHASRLRQR